MVEQQRKRAPPEVGCRAALFCTALCYKMLMRQWGQVLEQQQERAPPEARLPVMVAAPRLRHMEPVQAKPPCACL